MRSRLLDPFALHLSEEKKEIPPPLYWDYWVVTYFAFSVSPTTPLARCWRWWWRVVGVFLLSLPGFRVILTSDICNKTGEKRRKFIIVLFKWRWGEGGVEYKIQCAIIAKPWRLSSVEKKQCKSICELWHQVTFRNTTIYRIYKQEQHMQMTRHCLAFGLELQRALWRRLAQSKLRLLLKCHGTLLYLATDHYTWY